MSTTEFNVLFPTESLPQGRVEYYLGFLIELEPDSDCFHRLSKRSAK